MRCPECGEIIDKLDYSVDFNCTTFGREYGTCDIDGENTNSTDSQDNDTEDYNYEGYEYFCPHCNEGIELEDLVNEDISIKIDKKKNDFINSLI